jgi:transposase
VLPAGPQILAVTSSLAVLDCLGHQSHTREKPVSQGLQSTPAYAQLLRGEGIGPLLAQPIVLETGDIGRFPPVGTSASYCRCVKSTQVRNGKRKGQGNGNNGHPSLAWASMEAAQFAIRCNPRVQRFSQRQEAKSPTMLARKAVAHTWSRAGYDLMRDLGPFEVHNAFG